MNFKNTSIKVIGKMTFPMEMENKNGKTAAITTDNSSTDKNMAKDSINSLMEATTMAIFDMINSMEKANWLSKTGPT